MPVTALKNVFRENESVFISFPLSSLFCLSPPPEQHWPLHFFLYHWFSLSFLALAPCLALLLLSLSPPVLQCWTTFLLIIFSSLYLPFSNSCPLLLQINPCTAPSFFNLLFCLCPSGTRWWKHQWHIHPWVPVSGGYGPIVGQWDP